MGTGSRTQQILKLGVPGNELCDVATLGDHFTFLLSGICECSPHQFIGDALAAIIFRHKSVRDGHLTAL